MRADPFGVWHHVEMRHTNTTQTSYRNALSRADTILSARAPQTAKRRRWVHNARPTVFLDRCTVEDATSFPAGTTVVVCQWIANAGVERWLAGGHADSVYVDGHSPTVTVAGVRVIGAEQWTGATVAPAAAVAEAWDFVEAEIRRAWREPAWSIMATPGTTGRDLWLRTPAVESAPLMGTVTQELVRSTAMQGRIETVAEPESYRGRPVNAHCVDMRLAYGAVLRGMPLGEPEQLTGRRRLDEFGFARYRALVEFRPPAAWPHLGIIPTRTGDGLAWPTSPEWHGPSWADGAEIELALRHGWQVVAVEVLRWRETGDPFRVWSERLLGIEAKAADALAPTLGRLVNRMVRAILLHTVGAMVGGHHRTTVYGRLEDAPIGVGMLRVLDDGRASWPQITAAAWPETSHPEWSAHIRARTRRRLLDHPDGGGLLSVPAEMVVAVRTDAIYTTEAMSWPCTGRVGSWVRKETQRLDAWPASSIELVTGGAR